MSNQLNLDINAYETDDLIKLLNIPNNYSEEQLSNAYHKKTTKISKMGDIKLRTKLETFFTEIYSNLQRVLENNTHSQKYSKENKKYSKENKTHSKENTKVMHPMPEIINPPVNSSFQVKYPKGLINPIEKKITTEILCLDSIFRDMDKYKESSDFVYELPNPIENVISMKLLSAEIPELQETISTSELNNYMEITMYNGWYYDSASDTLKEMPSEGHTIKIFIPAGHPPDAILRETIQNQLNSRRDSFSFIHLGYDEYKYTLFFRYKTLIECYNWNASFSANYDLNDELIYPKDDKEATSKFRMPSVTYLNGQPFGTAHEDLLLIYLGKENYKKINSYKDDYATPCHPSGEPLNYKINFNPLNIAIESSVGWKLGFRKNIKTTNHVEECERIGKLDDTNRFNIQYYGIIPARTPYIGLVEPYYFLYVNDFVGNYNDTLNIAQKKNVFAKSILAKLQLSNSTFRTKFLESTGVSLLEKTRDYFGPVTIKKLHIKLLDKFNKVINTKKLDFSLTLQFEKLYSSVTN